jgi:hypothetical protein
LQYGVSVTLVLSVVLQQVFNLCRAKGVNVLKPDKLVYFNVVFACASSAVFWYITVFLDGKYLANDGKKDFVDYMVAAVLTLAFSKFFALFIVVPSVSKMLLTLFTMLVDVVPFLFIMLCYIALATQLFSTQY